MHTAEAIEIINHTSYKPRHRIDVYGPSRVLQSCRKPGDLLLHDTYKGSTSYYDVVCLRMLATVKDMSGLYLGMPISVYLYTSYFRVSKIDKSRLHWIIRHLCRMFELHEVDENLHVHGSKILVDPHSPPMLRSLRESMIVDKEFAPFHGPFYFRELEGFTQI